MAINAGWTKHHIVDEIEGDVVKELDRLKLSLAADRARYDSDAAPGLKMHEYVGRFRLPSDEPSEQPR